MDKSPVAPKMTTTVGLDAAYSFFIFLISIENLVKIPEVQYNFREFVIYIRLFAASYKTHLLLLS